MEIWTARPSKFYRITAMWLRYHGIDLSRVIIRMRKDDDWRPASDIKCEWLELAYEPIMVFEDSTKIVKAMQAMDIGMICQVNHRES